MQKKTNNDLQNIRQKSKDININKESLRKTTIYKTLDRKVKISMQKKTNNDLQNIRQKSKDINVQKEKQQSTKHQIVK